MRLAQRLGAALLLLTAILAESVQAARFSKSKHAVELSKVQALTFRKGRSTTHRRVSALTNALQLNCVGGSGKGLYEPETVRCVNAGSSFSEDDIEWTCTASLPPEFKLGSTDVICEGYDSPDDPFILKGSCALEYRLVLTDLGEEKFGRRTSWFSGTESSFGGGDASTSETLVNYIFWIVFLGILGTILYGLVKGCLENPRTRTPRRPRTGYGGGYDDGNDPPPPYDPYPPRPSYGFGKSAYGSQTDGTWRPGFWSGAAAGAAAGYFAGNRNNRAQAPPSGGWFGGRGGYDAGEGSSRSPPRSSGGSNISSQRYESTGFGGTRRR